MGKAIKSQQSSHAIGSAVVDEDDPIEYLRQRYKIAAQSVGKAKAIQNLLAPLDEEFQDTGGYFNIQNLQRGIAGPKITAKAIRLLEGHSNSSLLKRQNLVKK